MQRDGKIPRRQDRRGERLRRKLKAKKVPASCQTQQKGSLRTVQGPQAYQTHPPVQDRQAYQISPAYQASPAEQAAHHLKVPDHPMEMPHQAAQVHPEVPMFMNGQRRPPPYTTPLCTRPFITML